jgi:hypothetical protein
LSEPFWLNATAEGGRGFPLETPKMRTEIIWILREEPIPIAMIERIQMLGEDGLLGWLFS